MAFGRSLSSYLIFLQGAIVAFNEVSRARRVHILELYHKTRNMASILERLARLCGCVREHHGSSTCRIEEKKCNGKTTNSVADNYSMSRKVQSRLLDAWDSLCHQAQTSSPCFLMSCFRKPWQLILCGTHCS